MADAPCIKTSRLATANKPTSGLTSQKKFSIQQDKIFSQEFNDFLFSGFSWYWIFSAFIKILLYITPCLRPSFLLGKGQALNQALTQELLCHSSSNGQVGETLLFCLQFVSGQLWKRPTHIKQGILLNQVSPCTCWSHPKIIAKKHTE